MGVEVEVGEVATIDNKEIVNETSGWWVAITGCRIDGAEMVALLGDNVCNGRHDYVAIISPLLLVVDLSHDLLQSLNLVFLYLD